MKIQKKEKQISNVTVFPPWFCLFIYAVVSLLYNLWLYCFVLVDRWVYGKVNKSASGRESESKNKIKIVDTSLKQNARTS